MRTRLTQDQRRSEILTQARALFRTRGYAGTEMEDIRKACGISRGGLYHHFANKGAILDAIVAEEVGDLAKVLDDPAISPIAVLLEQGSSQLGNEPGIAAALKTTEEKSLYLSSLDAAIERQLSPRLSARLADHVCPGVSCDHIAELFLTVNAHINRRQLLGDWTPVQAADFAATALEALAPFLRDEAPLRAIIQTFRQKALNT